MGGNWKNTKYYPRKNKPGDIFIEGRASNGITLDNTGNIFLYSSHNENITNQLTSSNYTGSIEISPNNDKSFIGIIATSTDSLISQSPINVQMGATNYTTLNLNPSKPNIVQAAPIPPPTDEKFTHNPVDNISDIRRSIIPGKHKGTDFAIPVGSNIYAVWDGKVIVSQFNYNPNGFGTTIIIEHEDKGYLTLYAHLSKLLIDVNKDVKGGQLIALSGGEKGVEGAGSSTGPHLHFELRKGTTKTTDGSYNPAAYYNAAVLEPLNFLTGSTSSFILPNTESPEPMEAETRELTKEEKISLIKSQEVDLEGIEATLPENEDEGVVTTDIGEYSRIPTPEEQGGTVNKVNTSTPGSPPSSGKGCTKNDCKTSYPNLNFNEDDVSTTISLAELKKQILSKTNNNVSLAKNVWAIYWTESSRINYGVLPNSLFSTPNSHNYTGIQTDSGNWGNNLSKYFIGQKCFNDDVRCRAFALFSTQDDAINFMVDRAKAKGFDKTDNADKWADLYLNTWFAYNLKTNNPNLYNQKYSGIKDLYNTAIKYYNQV